MKSEKDLKQLKLEYESLQKKLKELSPEELKTVVGGGHIIPEFDDDATHNLMEP